MIYTTSVYAIVASLLVSQLLFPYHITWHSDDEKVAGDLSDDIPVESLLNRQRAVRTRRRKGTSRRYYPRILGSAPVPTGKLSASRIAKHFGTVMIENGTDDETTRRYKGNDIETANASEESTAPQIKVPPPRTKSLIFSTPLFEIFP